MKFNRLIGYGALLFSLSSYSNELFDINDAVSPNKRLENVCEIPEIRESIDNIKDDYEIVISREQNTLYLFSNGIKIDKFKVSTGKKSTPTQDGVYFIKSKTKDPEWYFGGLKNTKKYEELIKKYPNELVPGLSPDNPIFGYWIELGNMNNSKNVPFGMHGTPQENSIGKSISHGCIRVSRKRKNLETIVNLPNGTKVRIE